jgi:hypothetical protein
MAWLIASLVGLAMVVLNRQIAALIIREQNRFWRLSMGQRSIRVSRFVTVIVGTGFITMGVLAAIVA